MANARDILVVGGTGVVGARIGALLAPRFPGLVVIAARDELRAASVCRDIGHGATSRRIDVDDPVSIRPALRNVGTVMSCVAQREPHLLRTCIAHGLAYTDIAPRLAFGQGYEDLAVEARTTGARILLGAGLSPGISNMMAKKLAAVLPRVERIETAILLSIGDEYGPDSLNHVLEALTHSNSVFEGGRHREALPFSEGRSVRFPEPLGERATYLFPWSDVVGYPKTLGVRTALGRFALDPPWVGKLVSLLMRAGARDWLERPGVRRGNRRAIDRVKRLYRRNDRFALVVTAEGGGRRASMSLDGRHQADVTATGAAEFARALAADEVSEAGLWLPEQIVSYERFFAELATHGYEPTTSPDA
jgi:saccharopine dehydrogenase (NAD+, L-lysine forming)